MIVVVVIVVVVVLIIVAVLIVAVVVVVAISTLAYMSDEFLKSSTNMIFSRIMIIINNL